MDLYLRGMNGQAVTLRRFPRGDGDSNGATSPSSSLV